MLKLGLLGRNINYSFSRTHFNAKFENENLPFQYENFDIESITQLKAVLNNNPNLVGLNVTIPFKEEIIPYLDEMSEIASQIGAVNTIKIDKNSKLIGYNTDAYGFSSSLLPLILPQHDKALILGTGGASKAIAYSLKELGIHYEFVARTAREGSKYIFENLTENIIAEHKLIINCTPLGTHPNVNQCPDIPYDGLTKDHLLYDLIYNPIQTKFLICGELKGSSIMNGQRMLELQAEKAWEIWDLK